MDTVVQEEASGCGIASIAALSSRSYNEVKIVANTLGIFAEDPRLWSDPQYVRTLLRHFGIRHSKKETPFSSWSALPDLALLSTKWHLEKGTPFWHWTVFYRSQNKAVVLDPKKNLKTHSRTDLGKIKPKWFIKIYPASVQKSSSY